MFFSSKTLVWQIWKVARIFCRAMLDKANVKQSEFGNSAVLYLVTIEQAGWFLPEFVDAGRADKNNT